ncbi:hypothetical protein Q8A73_010163 [Channa argus]|nr:hypothetical protein Q8A73_010163 [Channa argus]
MKDDCFSKDLNGCGTTIWRLLQGICFSGVLRGCTPPLLKQIPSQPSDPDPPPQQLAYSVGPSGKLLQPEGDGAREREKAEWREEALRSVSGFMELCTSDPPPWIAIRDHSFSFYLFYCPALFLCFPSSIPRMKIRIKPKQVICTFIGLRA